MSQVAQEKTQEKEVYLSAYQDLVANAADNAPAWLSTLREKAIARFRELAFPTTRNEEWKYTNVTPIVRANFKPAVKDDLNPIDAERFFLPETIQSRLIFVNGHYTPELSSVAALPAGVTACNFSRCAPEILHEHLATIADYQSETFTALNTAFITDGALIHIPKGKLVEAPIQLVFISTSSEPFVSHPRILIVAESGAVATVIESYVTIHEGVYFTNSVTEVIARQGATIQHYRLQRESDSAFHIATTQVHQERDSNYTSYAISLGAELSRHNLNVKLADENIESTIDGLYVVNGKQHVDN
ncbi:MAG TPA: SufD family Fe-S cluster assembly protein, partial [Blastocatellia bacterium]|nr:SufD family Fe-S cluster assembly protein [Blastocatellia bacterium]